MRSGGEEVGKVVHSYDEVFSVLRPRAEALDGEPGLCDDEQSFLDTVLARADVEAPNVFSDEEIAAAAAALERYGAAIRQFDAQIPPTGPGDRDALIRATDKRLYADMKRRYAPLVRRLQRALAEQTGGAVDPSSVSVRFSGDSSIPRIAFQVRAIGILAENAIVAISGEQSVSLSDASRELFDHLPNSARTKFGTPNDGDPLTLEVDGGGKLFIMVYRHVAGGKVRFAGKVEVPSDALGRWVQGIFVFPVPGQDSPPMCPPPPSRKITPI